MKLTVRGAELALVRKARPTSPVLADQVLPALSAAAEGGALWAGIAATLAALGGRRGRRAAVEGLVSAALASGVANAPLKATIGRHRPGTGIGRLVVSELGRHPRSPSMPSSHAAVAAGFAVGAGLALPPVAAPLGIATFLVGWSRLNAGRHYASDVLVGFAVGAAAGVVVHSVARRVRPETPE